VSLENSQVLGEFVQILVWCLGAVLLVIQIIRSFRRSPPVAAEIDQKITLCKENCDKRFCGMKTKIEKVESELKDRAEAGDLSRAQLSRDIEALRSDMDEKFRELGEQAAAQETKTDMTYQRQIQMDQKLDVLLTRK
jgi:hypothetical protein